jgi:hypothetical protein
MSNEMYNVLARAADGIYEGEWALHTWCVWAGVREDGTCVQTRPSLPRPTHLPPPPPPGIAIGGDAFPGSTLSDHCLRYQHIPQVGTRGG